MAFIRYVPDDEIPDADRVPDRDHILRIHGIHPRTMRDHYQLYLELMHRPGPLTRAQREMVAVAVSAANRCHY
jgi:alkylhydroperoxidase family enzyme